MSKQDKHRTEGKSDFSEQIGSKAARKLKAQQQVTQTVWSGLGMMGLIGWSVSIPTLLGAALGMWLDENNPSHHSWTLALLTVGLGLGCFNAWHWVTKESREINEQEENKGE
ncbi:AtpZ/AtpI family protein [Chitinimonas sp. BJB300]|uniref:AtpZ/AtpI family protein n=1 Tax=Chitinimonas sp. BJB300 TaxID=1559339 RepID=UPI001E31D348|nr:AtpZ/AtpI family protein [Chitinimonas sp. BJB300]